MAVVEEVVEAASVEAVGDGAVADVIEGGGAGELDGVDGGPVGHVGSGAGAEGGPVVAGGVASVGEFGEEDGAGGVGDGAVFVAAGIPIGLGAWGGGAEVKVDADAEGGGWQGCGGGVHDEAGAGPVHGVGAPGAEGGVVDADLDLVGGAFEDLRDKAGAGDGAGDADDEVRFGGGAADVAVDVVVPGELVLVIARCVGGGGVLVFVVAAPEGDAEAELFELGGALDALGAGFGAGEGGEEEAGEDADDGDDDEQLDEGEGVGGPAHGGSAVGQADLERLVVIQTVRHRGSDARLGAGVNRE